MEPLQLHLSRPRLEGRPGRARHVREERQGEELMLGDLATRGSRSWEEILCRREGETRTRKTM